MKALLNSCRHRGAMICRERTGNARQFYCMYHGWSYNTDGSLKQVPGEELVIGTSQALVRVVGTEFALSFENGATQLVMEEGTVQFAPAGRVAQAIKGGELVSVDAAARLKINPVTRDAAQWPFPADSPWNRPLGDGTRLVPMQPAAAFGELRGVAKLGSTWTGVDSVASAAETQIPLRLAGFSPHIPAVQSV